MPVAPENIAEFFTAWTAENGGSSPVGQVAQWLADGGFEPATYVQIAAEHGGAHEPWYRTAMLDLILAYADHRLDAGPLTMEDVIDLRMLRRALHVSDQEFVERRPAEVFRLLARSLDGILADGVIDDVEDLYLVEFQAAFGLSYDQLLTMARPALEGVVATLRFESSLEDAAPGDRQESARAKLAALEPTYRLATMTRRSLGMLF